MDPALSLFEHPQMLEFVPVLPARIAASMAVARAISSLLYGAPPSYPWIVTVVSLASLSVAAIALALPAYRAARVDPLCALREE